jgi:hypothetical protein
MAVKVRIGALPRMLGLSLLLAGLGACVDEQLADPSFNPVVIAPAYHSDGPEVAIDKGHRNFHTAKTGYAPFAALLRADGYRVRSIGGRFDPGALQGIDVLVISNALGKPEPAAAFDSKETQVVADWVAAGGSLLLIADHTPFGSAAQGLASRFGVDMGKGYAAAPKPTAKHGYDAEIEFSGTMLGAHPILSGRGPSEEIHSVKSFTGQSLSVPQGAAALLKLPEGSVEAPDEETLIKFEHGEVKQLPEVGGRAQAIAFNFGRGRVVVMGEAAMFTAQVLKRPGKPDDHFGMAVRAFDDRQFALNTLHWLTRLLP